MASAAYAAAFIAGTRRVDIEKPLRELGPVSVETLRQAILAQDEAAWHEEQVRQESYEVHKQTQSIVLVFTDGTG